MSNIVLCAIDINRAENEIEVLQRAKALADLDGAQLDVITVIPDYGMSVVGGFFTADHTNQAMEHAKTLLSEVAEKALGPEANAKLRHLVGVGNAYHEILSVAEQDNASLIVLGAHRPDLRDYLLGPNASRVVRHARCSVYVVR